MTKRTDKRTRRTARNEGEGASLDRRSFMRLAGLGAGIAGASVGLGTTTAGAAEPAGTLQHAGYRETEHVQTYYRMARF